MFRRLLATAVVLSLTALTHAQPLSTAFTFQGQLSTAGSPATGTYDASFRLYDASIGGNQVGPTLCADNVAVLGGLFTTQLDFGAQFTGQQRFLEVAIRADTGLNCTNTTGFTTLTPRQPLTAAPNADFALTAAFATSATTAATATSAGTATNASQFNGQSPAFYLNAANLSAGALPDARLGGTYSSALTLSNTSNVFAGSGAGLTALNAANFAAGTLADTRLSANVPLLNLSNNFTGSSNTFTAVVINAPPPATGVDLNVGNIANVHAGPGVGDALRIGGAAIPMGLTTEVGAFSPILNLDVNFRMATKINTFKGGAVRIDSRSDSPTIQFLTRAAGSTVEKIPMMIDDVGVGLGEGAQTGELLRAHNLATSGIAYGLVGASDSTSGTGVLGNVTATSGGTVGVFGQTSSPGGTGVIGLALATSGTPVGVTGQSGWTSGVGVYGNAGFSSNGGVGVRGIASSGGHGVEGIINSGPGGVGVMGSITSPVAVAGSYAVYGTNAGSGAGVFGEATSTTRSAYGVLGSSNNASSFGIYSNDRVGAAGSKPFRIDHPDDPTNKYLFHYSTESPEVLNAYSGKVTLNGQGEAVVDMPTYFAKINKDPRYQLTPLGAAMPLLHVAEEIDEQSLADGAKMSPEEKAPTCSFRIAGGAPNGKVSWRIEAIRNDRWMQVHGAPVEVEKEGSERGTYQHPEFYGQPKEKATFYRPPLTDPGAPVQK